MDAIVLCGSGVVASGKGKAGDKVASTKSEQRADPVVQGGESCLPHTHYIRR